MAMGKLEKKFPEAYEICRQFELDEGAMRKIVQAMTNEIYMGLAKQTHSTASIKCFQTCVQDFPTGNERGRYLALDLGGSNFRVLLANLISAKEIDVISKTYAISKAIMEGPGIKLFDFLAESIAQFCKEHKIENDNLPLGFTFSFPCKHIGIDQGILVTWTKGFKSEGVVNKNVVEMLREAISRRGDLKVDIVAILNDTTGTLMSCAFQKQNCKIGMILGTGTNACYVEKTSNVEMFPAYQTSTKPHMIINCEWGAFGENGELDFVRTSYDKAVDRESLYPTKQVFEKCISGKYMGELVRHILVELMDKGVLFKDATSQILREREKFDTRFLSEIESDKPGQVRNACKVMDELGVRGTSEEDLLCLRHICQTISTRSAKLAACGLVSLIKKTKVKDIAVGIDGSVYCFHPHYHRLLMENMKLLLKDSAKFKLNLSKDGSGRGAALTAAVYTRRPPSPPKALSTEKQSSSCPKALSTEKQSSSCPLKASAPASMPTVRRFIQKVVWTFRHF
ncbi:hexokinase type 2 [Drosophila mojavensis]|uniref:hexokinase type 2 n=1 Tax=Drosophila mojavensis TaxID=7230 RepID=UPI001CD0EA25|nr:hexokinase type 2 [Drosophila mojavensis]